MDKNLLFLILIPVSYIKAMEQDLPQSKSLKDLPYEIVAYVASQSDHLIEGIKSIHNLGFLDKELRGKLNKPELMRMFIINYITNHPEKAKDEFIQLIQSFEFGESSNQEPKLKLVELLIDNGFEVNDNYPLITSNYVPTFEGQIRKTTPLMEAIEGRNKELVKLLISKGADVNMIADEDSRGTPLERLIYKLTLKSASPSDLDIIKSLIEAGANPDLKGGSLTQSARTLANHVMGSYRKEIIELLNR